MAEIDFTKHFVEFLKINYHFIVSAIRTQTDTIHIMANYAEESRLRLKIFEKLLKSSSEDLQQRLIETGIVHEMCQHYLNTFDELDVSTKKLTYVFLPFRNFQPVRNESLAAMSLIIQYRVRFSKMRMIRGFKCCLMKVYFGM